MEHFEVIVIGAGVAGIYQIKRLQDAGMNAVLLEADDDLGGTWYRNRYPGCRFDSESYTYGYSFSKEVLNEWHWKERFSSQPENYKYLNFVAEKFNLRKHMRFNSRVERMDWDDDARLWHLTLTNGETLVTRFVVTGVGILSVPTLPSLPGAETFKGESFHTYWWPSDGFSIEGKRVAVIGTGATGIQVIAAIADKVEQLTVLQRRPNWSTPLNNSEISDAEMADIRSRYDEIFARCAATPFNFEHLPDTRGFWNLSADERRATWDKLYDTPGFALLAGNFPEIFFDEEANRELSDYVADRIRQRVVDQSVAEKLIPKDHGFGMQRLPLETNYFEAYNRDNVTLVDLSETPIVEVTPSGIRTTQADVDVDVIVYATGFDAMSGALEKMAISGVGGASLKDKWKDGPVTFLGLLVSGFPNLLMLAGPQSASGLTNFPRNIESGVNWVTDLLETARANGVTRINARGESELEWRAAVIEAHEAFLARRSKSWFTGYNENITGREAGTVRYHTFFGGGPVYVERLRTEAEAGYPGVDLRVGSTSFNPSVKEEPLVQNRVSVDG